MAKTYKEWQTLLANAENALDQKEIQPPQSGKATEMRRMSVDAFMEIWRANHGREQTNMERF